jgi:hypothetical protein
LAPASDSEIQVSIDITIVDGRTPSLALGLN